MSTERIRRLLERLAAWWNAGLPHWVLLNARLPRRLGHDGFTLLIWTLIAGDHCDAELVAHEYRHVQHAVMGLVVGFWLAYVVEYAGWIVVEAVRTRPHAVLRRWWWKRVLTTAYHRVSWERDAYRWARGHRAAFAAVGARP